MFIRISIFHLSAKPGIRVVLQKYKSNRAEKKLARDTIAARHAEKTDITYNWPKTKTADLLCSAHRVTAGGRVALFVEN